MPNIRLTFEQIEAMYFDASNGNGENIYLGECKIPDHSEFCFLYTDGNGDQRHLSPEGEINNE